MNPYAFLAKLAGIGLVAGTAVAMVKLVEKVWPKAGTGDSSFEYIAVAGEFPPDDEETCADTADEAADHTAGTIAENEAVDHTTETAAADDAALSTEESAAAAPDAPNENPVDAPPAVPVTDPLKIADPADFQNWDDLGCQG